MNGPTFKIIKIKPEVAKRILSEQNRHNRKIRQRVVAQYAADMKAGDWLVTGEALKFTSNGELLDGQHRLEAVVEADVPVEFLVIENLDPQAQAVMDTGYRRQASDALQLAGYKNASLLAASARLARLYEGGTADRKETATNSQVSAFVESHPALIPAVLRGVSLRARIPEVRPTVLSVAWMLFSAIDEAACDEFFDGLINNATDGAGDPRNALLNRLRQAVRIRERLEGIDQLSMLIRVWNAWRRGQKLAKIPYASRLGKVVIPQPV